MSQINDLINFHFSFSDFKNRSNKVIPISAYSQLDLRIGELLAIREKIGSSSFQFNEEKLIPGIFRKFKNYTKDRSVSFDKRELRTLTYSLSHSEPEIPSIFINADELNDALFLLDSKWQDSYLIGLIDCFLKNWETENRKSLELLENFGASKLNNYQGKKITLLSFKNNKRFFSTKNGDLILGDSLAKLNKPVQEATKILGVPETWFQYSYFSKVIITYYEKTRNNVQNELENLNDVLQIHKQANTDKRLLSKIIIQANQPSFSPLQDKVKNIALKQIGDPTIPSKWLAFKNATELEKQEIFQARSILNEWITQQFINVFFNVCINDERRKKFWLKFASKISSFKVYGPLHTKSLLKRDERIAGYLDPRYEIVSSKKDVSAFILYIGDYMLIEFSNDGYACYAYKINGIYCPKLNAKLNSVDDLRNGFMPSAITSDANYYYHSEEGRLFHRDGSDIWETKFNNWMNQKVFK